MNHPKDAEHPSHSASKENADEPDGNKEGMFKLLLRIFTFDDIKIILWIELSILLTRILYILPDGEDSKHIGVAKVIAFGLFPMTVMGSFLLTTFMSITYFVFLMSKILFFLKTYIKQ